MIEPMDNLHTLIEKLNELLSLEGVNTREEIAGFIVGELIGDPDGKYKDLESAHPAVARIADLASDLEWSNGSAEELERMWQEMKQAILRFPNHTGQQNN